LTGENWYNPSMQNVYAFAWGYAVAGNRRWQSRLGEQSYFSYDAANALNKAAVIGNGPPTRAAQRRLPAQRPRRCAKQNKTNQYCP